MSDNVKITKYLLLFISFIVLLFFSNSLFKKYMVYSKIELKNNLEQCPVYDNKGWLDEVIWVKDCSKTLIVIDKVYKDKGLHK